MTLNGVMAPTLRYLTKFVYDVVVKQLLGLSRFQNLLLIVYDHINTICAIIQRLFNWAKQEEAIASTSDWLFLPTPMFSDEFLVPAGRPNIVQYGGLDGRVHFNYGGLIKLGLMGVGDSISVDA